MEYADFNCPQCNGIYDEKIKIPRMLIKCGHTYCQECLRKCHRDRAIQCPEDKTLHTHIFKMEDLPKNLTLIKLLQKTQKRLSSIKRPSTNSRLSESNEDYEFSSRKSSNGNNYNFSNYSCQAYVSEFNLNESLVSSNLCLIHRRPLEIICLDHKAKICTSCALFGEHKNHSLKSEEDVIREISVKAECLIEFYEIVEKQAELLESEIKKSKDTVQQVKLDAEDKVEKIRDKCKMFYKELRFLLKTKEKQSIEEIDINYKNFVNTVDESENIQSTCEKISNWKKEAQEFIDILNNTNEAQEKILELAETDIDLLTPGENLLQEIDEKLEELRKNNFEFTINIIFDFDIFNQNLDKFSILKFSEAPTTPKKDTPGGVILVTQSAQNLTNKIDNDPIFYKPIDTSPNRFKKVAESSLINYRPSLICDNSFISTDCNFFKDIKQNKNQISTFDSSFTSNNTLNTTKLPLSSDKVIFIKNQLKNECANFTGYLIGDEGAKKISELLLSAQFSHSPSKRNNFSKMKEIKLIKTGITDEGLNCLTNCLTKYNNLHTLNLSKIKISDESCTNILNIVKNNKHLRFLNLSQNNLSHSVKEKIKNAAKSFNSLLKVDI